MPCYRICKQTKDYNDMRALRKWWEEWDLRILILYILIAQLYLHFFGRLRRKSKSVLMMIVSVWLLYLFSDLLATIALGKLSKIKVDDNSKDNSIKPKGHSNNITMGEESLRVMWAPLILFYLGGPDTITVLRVEENQLWMRHLIGLLTQGLRTAYALIVTWNKEGLSLLALLVFVPGIIKYGERVWVVRSRSHDYKRFVKSDLDEIDKISASRPASLPTANLVLLAYSWFQALLPHDTSYRSDTTTVEILKARLRDSVKKGSVDAFKLIEIELSLMYDMLFSKVGTIFTVWGSILRFLSFSLIVSVLVIYITCNKPRGHLEGDHIVTIILLAGAIFLEIAGIIVQLVSDWAMVWACKNGSKWATWVLFLHEILNSKSQRWSGVMGQFSLQEFCENYKPPVFNTKWEWLFGREKMLKRFSLQKIPDHRLKDTIIRHIIEKSEKAEVGDTSQTSTDIVVDVDTSQTSTQKIANVDTVQTSTEKVANVGDQLLTSEVKRGEWTLSRYDCGQQFKWSIELEFDQSIVIWHVATEVCYQSDRLKIFGKDEVKLKVAKILSDYMMYLVVACPDRFPFCNKYDEILQDYADMKKLFDGVENKGNTTDTTLVNKAQRLVQGMKENPNRWDIIGSMWVEMLCYASRTCPVKNHIQELRHGGEFLTHVWLLLFHFGITKKQERSNSSLKDEGDSSAKSAGSTSLEIKGNEDDKRQYEHGIQANREELEQNTVGGWTSNLIP
ncbi:hypothetical protein RHGRI_019447 [Rhododendron griersonianum]|uniref:DUF4220 domain-containing protein n=1 Tax=Rhododendron griersonianum TaxID=479676 RepID=A0AAV6JH39_9ERIC|nr:hypothetical protein RHGRI_019447 [Rhododendron griersonianum]